MSVIMEESLDETMAAVDAVDDDVGMEGLGDKERVEKTPDAESIERLADAIWDRQNEEQKRGIFDEKIKDTFAWFDGKICNVYQSPSFSIVQSSGMGTTRLRKPASATSRRSNRNAMSCNALLWYCTSPTRLSLWIAFFLLLLLVVVCPSVQAFVVWQHSFSPTCPPPRWLPRSTMSTRLYAGDGVATNYTWHEEAFEIEVSVKVPKETRAKDIAFRATSRSVDLRLIQGQGDGNNNDNVIVLLDGQRPTRGRINLDGTYWVISDSERDAEQNHRIVTVTIEKLLATPKDDFEVVEYDWKGVYPDDETEVTWRHYDEPESLDVRQYAASLGVDIDNINMSMVDKTMFSSGLNLTQASLDQMTKAGLLQHEEVTQQADGREFTVQDDGTPQAYTPYGPAVHPDEMEKTTTTPTRKAQQTTSAQGIPFLDTNSPWHQSVPVPTNKNNNVTTTMVQQMQRNLTRAAFAADAALGTPASSSNNDTADDDDTAKTATAKDPIDTLTKKRLQEILKSQGLPISGNKQELQQRLRQRVNALLQGKQQPQA